MVTKKQLFYVGFAVVLYWFIIKKVSKAMTEKEALKRILDEYGIETARNVERMFRLETNHFKSGGYKKTNGAGMEAVRDLFPFGWSQKYFVGVGYSDQLVSMVDSGGRSVKFIKFDTPYDGMKVLANWLQSHRVGNWYSNDKTKQQQYEAKVNKIRAQYVDAL